MKKTLLIAAAALTAGVITSQAQVYSQNIVGYVNVPLPLGFTAVSVPLNSSTGNNSLTNTIPNTGALDGAQAFFFNGTKFNSVTFDSTMSTGFGDPGDSFAVPAPVVNPGTGFFINNNTGVPLTNTYVGSVALSIVPGSCTNYIAAGKSFIASIVPLGGGITSSLQFTNTGSFDGTQIFFPNIVGGNVHGYNTTTFDSTLSTGFGDVGDSFAVPEPTIPVGSAFIFDNNAGLGVQNWVQAL